MKLNDFLELKNHPEQLKELVLNFLRGEGNNHKLANIIESKEGLSILLGKIELNKLKREMGPAEEGLIFSESKEKWESRIDSFIADIKDGHEPLPLIVTNFWSDLDLSDGAHRHAALEKLGIKEYWSVCILEG